MDRAREMGVGDSQSPDPATAAHDACVAALAGRTPGADDLMVLFPTVEYDPAQFFSTCAKVAAPAHVVGCSSFSSFTDTTIVRRGTVAAFLPTSGMSFGIAGVDHISREIYGAAHEVAQRALDRAGGDGAYGGLMVSRSRVRSAAPPWPASSRTGSSHG